MDTATAPAAATSPRKIVKHKGPDVTIVTGQDWPGRTPYDFLVSIVGLNETKKLLGDDPDAYSERWSREAREGFRKRGVEEEWDDFLQQGGDEKGCRLEWAIMDLPPHRSFQLHAHKTLEVIHVLRGRLYERRMAGPCHISISSSSSMNIPPDLSQLDPPPSFVDSYFPADSINVNERESVHQSWTEDEGCLLICIWAGEHLNVPESHYSKTFTCGGRCHGGLHA